MGFTPPTVRPVAPSEAMPKARMLMKLHRALNSRQRWVK